MNRPAACILLAFMVVCSLRGPESQIRTPAVQAAEIPVARSAGSREGGAVRIDFRAVALREARMAGIRRPQLFVRQIAQESSFDPCAGSSAGAKGIGQLMDATGAGWGVTDPYDPHQSLRAAAKAMAKYEKSYGSYSVALQAYNAGPGAVAEYRGRVPYGETREYVRRIMGDYPIAGLQRVYTRPGGYTPNFAKRLRRLQAAVRARGGTLDVVPGNGFRSVQLQGRMWEEAKRKHGGWKNAKNFVAPKFCSSHSRGEAADLRGDLELAHRLGPKYGVHFRIPNEPWHGSVSGY